MFIQSTALITFIVVNYFNLMDALKMPFNQYLLKSLVNIKGATFAEVDQRMSLFGESGWPLHKHTSRYIWADVFANKSICMISFENC